MSQLSYLDWRQEKAQQQRRAEETKTSQEVGRERSDLLKNEITISCYVGWKDANSDIQRNANFFID